MTFPLQWTRYGQWRDLERVKGIPKDRSIIVYGYHCDDAETMADELARAGYRHIRVFDQFMTWSADTTLPMERLPRYRYLVYPEWVSDLLAGNNPPEWKQGDVVVCHASYRYRGDYEAGHIPGAIHLDTERLETPGTWNLRNAAELRRAFTELGIRYDTTVIVYGRFSHPNNEDPYPGRLAGHLSAMRCAQIMLYAGVEDVRILNGGMSAWQQAGYKTTTEEGVVKSVGDFGVEIPQHPELIINTTEAKQFLSSKDAELVSVRSWEEFIGKVSGYHYIDKVGRIPGAVFGNCGSDAYHMENYRNIDHTMREYHEIASLWAESGIVPEKRIAFYCGTGWRGSEAFFNAWLMGWPRISVYDGGWLEWSSDPNNPVETGIPTEQLSAS
jgi:thiosulfate/3-mercaptopyruvate sulfurtransferase